MTSLTSISCLSAVNFSTHLTNRFRNDKDSVFIRFLGMVCVLFSRRVSSLHNFGFLGGKKRVRIRRLVGSS